MKRFIVLLIAIYMSSVAFAAPPFSDHEQRIVELETKVSVLLDLLDDNSLEENGYAWVGGILIQWGTVSTSDLDTDFDFPIPFPVECLTVVPNSKRTEALVPIDVYAWTASNFSVNRNDSIDGWYDLNYIAIGY